MNPRSIWPFDDNESVSRFNDLTQQLRRSADGGVAFFGAGASVAAGFPTWDHFYKSFSEYFGADPLPERSDRHRDIPGEIDFHTNRDHGKSLDFIKSIFARNAPQVPPLYRVSVTTQSLRYFYTTNIDEMLAQAAYGESVACYPNYSPMDARFVYLHGRASIATSVHDHLVVGARGYQSAYDETSGGLAKSKLRFLSHYPVLFVGFSMTDRQVVSSLSEIAQAARLGQVVGAGGQESEAVSQLSWYSLEKAPDRKEPGRDERKRRRTHSLGQVGVKVIWYQDGGSPDPYRAALDVVQALQRRSRELSVAEQEGGFVDRLIAAEQLAAVESPTRSQVKRAVALVDGHPRIASAFWNYVDGLEWFRRLRDAGVLAPKRVFVSANGDRHAPYWRASGLLRRVAAVAPAEVAQFLSSVDTDNWAAIRGAFQILEALDESSGASVGPQFAKWTVAALSIEPLLLYQVSESSQQLDSDGKSKAALALLEAVLRRIAESDVSITEGIESEFSQAIAPILGRSESALVTLRESLEAALEERCGEPDDDNVQHLRHAIERHRMDLTESSAISLLIDVIRDTLIQTKEDVVRSRSVTNLLQSSWPTARRIGIAHCFLLRSDLPLHEARIITLENLSNQRLFHELAKLVSDDTTDISDERLEILTDFVMSLRNSSSEEDQFDYQLWSRVLPGELLPIPPEPIEDDDEDSDRHLFRDFYFSGVFSPGAPLDIESFAERAAALTSEGLLALVRDPAAHGVRVTLRHSTSEMWSLLAEYTQSHDTLDPLLQIRPGDLKDRQVWRAIEAMVEIAGDNSTRWNRVLNWIGGVIAELPADQLWPIGGLLEGIGTSIPLELSEDARALAMQVLVKAKRTIQIDSGSLEDTFFGGYLNSASGKAMGALLELVHREIAEPASDAEAPRQIPGWFKENVLEPMDRDSMSLGIDAWVGVGLYFALLSDRSPDAVTFVVRHLTSVTSESPTAAIAFWSGHLSANNLWTGALNRLRDAYQIGAPTLQTEGVLEDDLRDRFFQHMVIGALRGVAGYDELLLSTLDLEFNPGARGSIVFALGQAVREMSDSPDTQLRTTVNSWFQRYWTKHVQLIGGSDGPHLAGYLRWLSDLKSPPREIKNLIEESLNQVNNGFHLHNVFEYLGRYAEDDPVVVLELLSRCVDWYRRLDDAWLHTEKVRDLLDRLAPLTRHEHEAALRDVLDGLAELDAISTADVHRYID